MTPQLDQPTREALSALDQPPPGVEDRLLAAILQTTGGGGGDGGGGGSHGGGSESALVYATKIVGATLGLTAAGLALVAASAIGVRSLRATPERASAAITSPTHVVGPSPSQSQIASENPAVQPEASPHAGDEPSPSGLHDPDRTPPEPVGRQVPARDPSDVAKPSASPAPTLEAELALLEAARGAAPAAALAILERHRVEFEHGVLADEREVLRVETLCALGRASAAESVASAFLAARPSSPLRSRIEPACKKF